MTNLLHIKQRIEGEEVWQLWSEVRPTDTKAKYRWRVPERMICKMLLRPEWTEELYLCGMGWGPQEWWPVFSRWDGYNRSVVSGLEWRLAKDDETEIFWGGLDLLPSPFTGKAPVVRCTTPYIGAAPYQAERLSIHSWMVESCGWADATKMQSTWNRRDTALQSTQAKGGEK